VISGTCASPKRSEIAKHDQIDDGKGDQENPVPLRHYSRLVVEHSEYQQAPEEKQSKSGRRPIPKRIGSEHEIRYGWEWKDEPRWQDPATKMIPNQHPQDRRRHRRLQLPRALDLPCTVKIAAKGQRYPA